jgi:hypothetical protein
MTGVGSPPSARHSVPGRVEEGVQQAGQGRVVAPDLSRTPQVVQMPGPVAVQIATAGHGRP